MTPGSGASTGTALDVRIDPSAAPRAAAVCTVAELFPVPDRGLMSGIDKRPVDHPVRVLTHGVLGDVQGDREHHGGIFKAVYAISREMRAAWGAAIARELPDGFFGENLATEGIDVDEAIIGERWRVGTALLEVTSPRTPCGTFAARMGERTWARRFTAGGRCGAYLRVIEEGAIAAGDGIQVVSRPDHGVSVGEVFRGLDAERAAALRDWSAETGTIVYEGVARAASTVLERTGEPGIDERLRSTGRGLGLGMGL